MIFNGQFQPKPSVMPQNQAYQCDLTVEVLSHTVWSIGVKQIICVKHTAQLFHRLVYNLQTLVFGGCFSPG